MSVALVLGAVLAALCVVYVAWPFLREPEARDDVLAGPGPLAQRHLALAEERDRALAALKELEFDHRTGQISDEDYRELVGVFRRRVADALRALEPRAGSRGVEGASASGRDSAPADRTDLRDSPLAERSVGTAGQG